MDLAPYTGKGFGAGRDLAIAETPVKGLDRAQTQGMVRLCPQTEAFLYGPEFSPTRVRYRRGSRACRTRRVR